MSDPNTRVWIITVPPHKPSMIAPIVADSLDTPDLNKITVSFTSYWEFNRWMGKQPAGTRLRIGVDAFQRLKKMPPWPMLECARTFLTTPTP